MGAYLSSGSPLSICAKVFILAIPQQVQQLSIRLHPAVAQSLRTPTNVDLPAPFRAMPRPLKAQKVVYRNQAPFLGALPTHDFHAHNLMPADSVTWIFWRLRSQGLFEDFMVLQIGAWGGALGLRQDI